MASAGSATAGLRHSFLAPNTTDPDVRAKRLTRTPSLPSQKSSSSKPNTKRTSGLFESSSESGSESSAHELEPSPTERRGKKLNRRETSVQSSTSSTAAMRHHSLGASPVKMASMPSRDNASVNNERKGLFEFDDDTADSVETLRERVKLRQKKKEHEVLSLRSELHAALTRVGDVSDELTRVRREKDECAIRMDECQRIIEKRNKQLIKASEKLTRLTEQSESQVNALQQQVNDLLVQVEKTKTHGRAALERQRSELDEKLTHQRVRLEAQLESVTLAASEKLRLKDADEAMFHQRIAQLEAEVVDATTRIAESSEYQVLLKRCEDAEAISRGLRFQLEKAQNEKKYLKQQLAAASSASTAQTTNAAPSFVPSAGRFAAVSMGRGDHSPASSVASADLSSFDFSRADVSPPMSPVAAPAPTLRKPSLNVSTGPDVQRRAHVDDATQGETSSKDIPVYGGTHDGDAEDGPLMPSLATPQLERTESKPRAGSGSINFFEKISIKFKRSPSSPRNSTPAGPGGTDELASSSPANGTSASKEMPPPHRRKVLSKRPKMYVAKSASDYEESSDSIFGSDSESDVSSDGDDDDQPPPPPPKNSARSPTGSVDASPVAMPPPPPPLFGHGSDADGDSSSDDGNVPTRSDDLRRVILPTPVSPPPVVNEQTHCDSQPAHRTTSAAPVLSSSEDSDSVASEAGGHEQKNAPSAPAEHTTVHVDVENPKLPVKTVKLSSDSENEATRRNEKRRHHRSNDDTSANKTTVEPRKEKRDRSRSSEGDASAKVNRMNEYMEARARKRQEKLSKKEEKEHAEHKQREEYEKEWERMAEEERERRRKQQKARRTGKRRPSSMKTVRVSQMRHQLNKHQKDGGNTMADDSEDDTGPPQPDAQQRRGDESSGSDSSEDENNGSHQPVAAEASSPPLPPEPTAVNTDLYLRQQARLREHHEMEMKKKQESAEADQVRGQIHRRVELWAFAKELHHMILTLDQISSNEALRQCQLMVVQSPDPETLRKAYRNIIRIIHPDKVRNASITEQLEAKELFTVLNQAFEKFKAQQQ